MPLASAMRIWDGIFAEEVRMDQVIVHVCITLLLRIRHLRKQLFYHIARTLTDPVRTKVLPSDYPGVLTLLLKYPQASPELPLSPALLLSQALTVLKNPSPSAGAAVTLQNQETLGIPSYAPDGTETTPSLMHTQTLRSRQKTAPAASNRSSPAASRTYGFESIARGLMEKAQASGFDKTIISTVSEFRKNLPDFNTQTAPTFPFRNFTTEAVPDRLFSDDALPAHKPPSLQRVRTLLDAEREIAELRLSMIGMGKAMGTWLDIVNPPSNTTEPNQAIINNDNDQSASAWTGLKRLQESLLDGGAAPTSDLARVWAWSQDLQSTSLSNVTDFANGPGTAHMVHEDQHSNLPAQHTPVIPHVEVPSYQPSSATSASFDSPRFHRPTTSIHSLNSPRNLDNYTSPSFPPSGFGNKRTSQTFHPTHSQVYAPPAKQAAPNLYPTPDSPPDMPFKMAKSADYEETFDMQPAKKANVDPLLGLGI
jgi:TBC1 domain family protein 5